MGADLNPDERTNALLTKKQREYVRGHLDPSASYESKLRARIRDRFEASLLDMALLSGYIEIEVLQEMYEGVEAFENGTWEEMEPEDRAKTDELIDGLRNFFVFTFYNLSPKYTQPILDDALMEAVSLLLADLDIHERERLPRITMVPNDEEFLEEFHDLLDDYDYSDARGILREKFAEGEERTTSIEAYHNQFEAGILKDVVDDRGEYAEVLKSMLHAGYISEDEMHGALESYSAADEG